MQKLDITIEDLKRVLGTPTKVNRHQYYFRCPECARFGNDKSGDNLLFNDQKGVLKCFACDNGAKEVLRLINNNKVKNTSVMYSNNYTNEAIDYNKSVYFYHRNANNLLNYWAQVIEELQQNEVYYKKLYAKHGIEKDAAQDLGIGLDFEPNFPNLGKMEPCFIFPMIMPRYENFITGFELRQIEGNKVIRRSPSIPTSLCKVWGLDRCTDDTKYAVIVEGFKDACNLYSLFKNSSKKLYEWFIYTCPHGVGSLLQCMHDIDWSQFSGCYLILDNDEAGDNATNKIINDYPFFKDKRNLLKGFKDITDYKKNKLT